MRASLVLLMLAPFAANAQINEPRAESWEIGFHLMGFSSDSLSGDEGALLDIDSALGWGFSGAYNFNEHLAALLELSWSRPDYTATRVIDGPGLPDTISAQMDAVNVHIKGAYYFREGTFTPFIELGIGWTQIDSNIAEGPPVTGCWWDPWWGYICADFFDTYHETRTSYTSAFGVRWDLTPEMLLKVSYGLLEVDTSKSLEDASLDVFRIGFGWKY